MLLVAGQSDEKLLKGFVDYPLDDGNRISLWGKGYFFDSDNRLYFDVEICEWLAQQINKGRRFSEIIPKMNGGFSVVLMENNGIVSAGLDRFGTIPIYYFSEGSQLILSEDFWEIAGRLNKYQYNFEAVIVMIILGHTTGKQTLLREINRLFAANLYQFICRENRISITSQLYWEHSYHPTGGVGYEDLRTRTAETINRVFSRYSKGLKDRGWGANIALSGGLDSRLAFGMLYKDGIPVRAYSYGPEHNLESQTAEKIAAVMKVPYLFTGIDARDLIDPELIRVMTNRVGMQARFTVGIGSELALKSRSNEGVIISGHPGNLPSGDAMQRGGNLLRNRNQAIQHFLNMHQIQLADEFAQTITHQEIRSLRDLEIIPEYLPFHPDDPIGGIEGMQWAFHFTDLLALESRTFEQYGKWMMPYCDYDLIDYYSSMPKKYRYRRFIHTDSILQEIFIGELKPLAEISISGFRPLRTPTFSWKDWFLLYLPPSIAGDIILKSQTRSRRLTNREQENQPEKNLWGPDPIDYWWNIDPEFKKYFLDEFRDWDGLNGIIDMDALVNRLQKPLHPLILRFDLALLLTMKYFQNCLGR